MNKSKVIMLFAIGMLIANILLIGFMVTHKPHPDHRGGRGPRNEIIKRLDFSTAQVKKYDVLIQWHRGEIDKADQHIMELKNALYQTFDEPGERAKDSLMTEVNKQLLAIEKIHYKHFKDIEALCTKEQMPAFKALTHDLADYFHPGGKRPRK